MLAPGDSAGTAFDYNVDGSRTKITYPSGVTVNSSYDLPSGRIQSVLNRSPSGSTLKRVDYTYTIGTLDTELAQKVHTNDVQHTTVNTYDALGRLTDAVPGTGAAVPYGEPTSFHFGLDGNGNRTSLTHDGRTTTWAYDSAGLPCWSTTEAVSGTPTCGQRPATYSHDANGNDLSNTHQTYEYNSAQQPTSAGVWSIPGTQQLGFRGSGISELVQDGSRAVQQNFLGVGARGSTYYAHASNGTVLSQRSATGQRRNYLYDGEGTVIGLADATPATGAPNGTGALKTSYHYEPYGHPSNTTPLGDENPFGYRGAYTLGVGSDGVICGGPIMLAGGLYDAQDGRYTAMAFGLPSPGEMVDAAWKYRKQIGTVIAAGVCIGASAGACVTAAGIYLGAATVDNGRRLATEPGFGVGDAVRAEIGDIVSAGLMGAMPASALTQGASRAKTAERLLPKSTIGRLAVNSTLTAPSLVAGLIWK